MLVCLIRDLSEIGARLEFAGPTELPKTFCLLVVATNRLVPVEVAWQRAQAAGVHFTGPDSKAPPRKFQRAVLR